MFINGNCIEEMKSIEENSISLVVTSPPYNAGKSYEDHSSEREYEQFAGAWVAEIPRLLAPNGSFWLNVGYMKLSPTETLPLSYLYHPILRRLGLHFIQEIVWHYEGGMSYKKRFTHRSERWLWCVKAPTDYVFNLDAVRDPRLNRTRDSRNHPLGKNPTDVWYFDRVVGGTGQGQEKTDHPCQFPEAMIERIVKACSNIGDHVLDPFGGSGTVAVVAQRLGRQFISIERDPIYHEIARQRHHRSSLLFNFHNRRGREAAGEGGS